MISSGRRDNAVLQRVVTHHKQAVQRAAFLIGRRELKVFKLEIDLRPGQFRQRLADQRRRANNRSANARMRRPYVIQGYGKGGVDFCCSGHGLAP